MWQCDNVEILQVRRPEHAGFWAGARAAMLMKSLFHWTINPDYAPRSNENAFPEEISFQKSSKTTVPLRTFWFLFPQSAICFSHKSPKDHRAATPLFFVKNAFVQKNIQKHCAATCLFTVVPKKQHKILQISSKKHHAATYLFINKTWENTPSTII